MIQFFLILFSQPIFFGVLKMNWSKTFINFLRSSLSGASINTEFYWNIFKRPLFCKSRDDASKLGRIIITICSTVLCTLCGFLGNLITQCENLTCSMDKRERNLQWWATGLNQKWVEFQAGLRALLKPHLMVEPLSRAPEQSRSVQQDMLSSCWRQFYASLDRSVRPHLFLIATKQ